MIKTHYNKFADTFFMEKEKRTFDVDLDKHTRYKVYIRVCWIWFQI